MVEVPDDRRTLEIDALGALIEMGLRCGALSPRSFGEGEVDEGSD
jgi:hypothetical protein